MVGEFYIYVIGSVCACQFVREFARMCICIPANRDYINSKLIKGKGLDTCYSATDMSQTRDQQRFTISEVAADLHEPMVPQRIMWPSIARANGQLDPRCS